MTLARPGSADIDYKAAHRPKGRCEVVTELNVIRAQEDSMIKTTIAHAGAVLVVVGSLRSPFAQG
ncbi:hypothetical protein [Parafrigoribacterium humi]|jgi:hypothetical protein|uniref:hypothetical protein n=1 Tax=Parafrigoribacterium humi TaxID=3144664 RepID=UPI0032EE4F79